MSEQSCIEHGQHRHLLAALIIVLACSLVTGCSTSSTGRTKATQQQDTTAASENTDDRTPVNSEASTEESELTTAEKRETALTSFIETYNAVASTPFILDEYFNPQDRDSTHYRTEYRLSAWEDGKGAAGKVGDISVDFVAYRNGVRMYAAITDVDIEQRANLLEDALNAYLTDDGSSSIDAFVQEYREGDNKELSGSKLSSLNKQLNGYIGLMDMMLEIPKPALL